MQPVKLEPFRIMTGTMITSLCVRDFINLVSGLSSQLTASAGPCNQEGSQSKGINPKFSSEVEGAMRVRQAVQPHTFRLNNRARLAPQPDSFPDAPLITVPGFSPPMASELSYELGSESRLDTQVSGFVVLMCSTSLSRAESLEAAESQGFMGDVLVFVFSVQCHQALRFRSVCPGVCPSQCWSSGTLAQPRVREAGAEGGGLSLASC